MVNIEDKSIMPSFDDLSAYVNNKLFDAICEHVQSEYQARCCIEYSGDKVLLGWNVKYKKAGKTLCTVYPRDGHFYLLLVVGKKEKERVEQLLPELSQEFRKVYSNTQEGMGQRWLIFDMRDNNALYEDILKVVRLRRESK